MILVVVFGLMTNSLLKKSESIEEIKTIEKENSDIIPEAVANYLS